MKRYAVRHETLYAYGAPVDLGFHLLHLTPLSDHRQTLRHQTLVITPEPAGLRAFCDHFGNAVHHVTVETTHDRFSVTLSAEVEVAAGAAPDAGPAWETIRDAIRGDDFPATPAIVEFTAPSPLVPRDDDVTAYAAQSFTGARPITAALRDFMARIHRDFTYAPNSTDISTKVSEVIAARRGVCQDFAHVMIAGLRGLGLPARYVSGYIHTHRPEDGAVTRGADMSHAWVSAWCGGDIGWLDLDPTNDLVVADEHVVVACGRDFSDVTPVRGVILGGGQHTLSVAVSVTGLHGNAEPAVAANAGSDA